jgi:hypothetical protein
VEGKIVGGIVDVLDEGLRVPFEAGGGVEDMADGGDIVLGVGS